MWSLIRCGLVHFWVTSRSHLLFHTVSWIWTWTRIHSVCCRWLLCRAMLMALASYKLARVVTTRLRITCRKCTSSALNILGVPTNSLCCIRPLMRQKSSSSWTAGTRCRSIEIIRSTFALSIYWLSQLRFLSWFWCFHVICDHSATVVSPWNTHLIVRTILSRMMLFGFS